MFWRKSKKQTADDPAQLQRELDLRAELKRRLAELFEQNRKAQFTIRHLESKVHPPSVAALALALAELQQAGVVDRYVRVESPESHGGIEDFASPDDVPDEIYDWRTQQTVPVTPENTAFIFKAHEDKALVAANG